MHPISRYSEWDVWEIFRKNWWGSYQLHHGPHQLYYSALVLCNRSALVPWIQVPSRFLSHISIRPCTPVLIAKQYMVLDMQNRPFCSQFGEFEWTYFLSNKVYSLAFLGIADMKYHSGCVSKVFTTLELPRTLFSHLIGEVSPCFFS